MKKIICGFAGIGKSYAAKNIAGVVDLESTPFNKDWETYTRIAEHMAKNGYIVLMSCHKDLRQKLKEKGIEYSVAIPTSDMKHKYLWIYQRRGNDEKFIKLFEDNFEKFIEEIEHEEMNITYIHDTLSALLSPTRDSLGK